MDFNEEINFDNIANFYISTYNKNSKYECIRCGTSFRHNIIVDFENSPLNINSISSAVKEDLFKIITAPVVNEPPSSYTTQANEYINKNSWDSKHVKYIVKTTGECLSFPDQTFFKYFIDNYKEKYHIKELEQHHYFDIYNNLAGTLDLNVEFALLIIILKKPIESSSYYEKFLSRTELRNIQREYNENIIFLCELQENVYGSVSEQTALFIEKMPYYFKSDNYTIKNTAIDNIILADEKSRKEKSQNFLSIAGFLFTIIFGLPSIYETLSLLRKLFQFIKQDIPLLTIVNTSVIIWFSLILYLFFKFKIKQSFLQLRKKYK